MHGIYFKYLPTFFSFIKIIYIESFNTSLSTWSNSIHSQRSDQLKRSRLDEIPGLGQHRQKLLLAHFRSVDYIREATFTQLTEVTGIGSRLAQDIYDYFHPV